MNSSPLTATTPKRKAKMTIPNAPKRKRESTSTKLFKGRILEWQQANAQQTEVIVTIHNCSKVSRGNFVMMRQTSLLKKKQDNAVIVHCSNIPRLILGLESCMKINENNQNREIQNNSQHIITDAGVPDGSKMNPIMVNDKENDSETASDSANNPITIKEATDGSKDNPIIIDEWDINSYQSLYRKELAKIYFDRMNMILPEINRAHCEGCAYNSPSQRHHICLIRDNYETLEMYFNEIIDCIKEEEANKDCSEVMKNIYNTTETFYISNNCLKADLEWQKEVKSLFTAFFKDEE